MAELTVRMEGIAPTASGAMVVANTNTTPIYVAQGMPPGLSLYSTLLSAQAGQVGAPYNFLSIFNPISSGKIYIFYQFTVFPWAGAATSTINPMTVSRTSAASGGTLRAAADVNKFITSQSNTTAEVRINNPTITTSVAVPIISVPPAVTSAGVGIGAAAVIVPPSGAAFHVLPGEGVCARTTVAGDADQLWDMGFVWGESNL